MTAPTAHSGRRIRLLLVDDHPVVREGLRGMLAVEPDIEVVAECGSGGDAVRLAAELRPDVVLMDLRMPGMDGVAATSAITAAAGQAGRGCWWSPRTTPTATSCVPWRPVQPATC